MELRQGLHRVGAFDVEAIRRQAEQEGFATFVLPASGIVDRASFFDAIRATFPLDPPVLRSQSWDALADSMWEGLYTHPAARIMILWPSTKAIASSAPHDFETALNVFADVANTMADPQATRDRPKEIAVVVE